jgi:hypothetical protein
MNIPSKLHRAILIAGVVIGMLTMTDTSAYGRVRVSGVLRTPVGDVYIESGHRHHRYYHHRRYWRNGYYYYHRPRYYYYRHYHHRRYR